MASRKRVRAADMDDDAAPAAAPSAAPSAPAVPAAPSVPAAPAVPAAPSVPAAPASSAGPAAGRAAKEEEEEDDDDDDDDEEGGEGADAQARRLRQRRSVKRQAQAVMGSNCPYMDTVRRYMLDFDFEKLCSVSLSNHNVYACLVCGKYFQGRGPASYAHLHSVDVGHHVFANLRTLKVRRRFRRQLVDLGSSTPVPLPFPAALAHRGRARSPFSPPPHTHTHTPHAHGSLHLRCTAFPTTTK